MVVARVMLIAIETDMDAVFQWLILMVVRSVVTKLDRYANAEG